MTNIGIASAVDAAINALSDLHQNLDHISRRAAVRAAEEGREAYWSVSQYHDQSARNLLDEANDLGVAEAIKLRISSRGDRGTDNPHRLINTLIPLNPSARAAVDETRRRVTDAYASLTFKGV